MVKIPHFFKAGSRLGTPNPPYRQKKVNFGVEDAPDSILDNGFLNHFKSHKIDNFSFPKPEDIHPDNLFSEIVSSYTNFQKFTNQKIKDNETQVVIGGDDSVTLPSILAVLERISDINRFGYIRFDSHADMNLYKKSPTKNFHGMYMRPLYGNFDIPEINRIVRSKIKPQNSIFIGNLDLDEEEKKFFRKIKIRNMDRKDLQDSERIRKLIADFSQRMNHIHISIDIDVFKKKAAPATGIPAINGLLEKDILPVLIILREQKNLSFDLVEVNPRKKGAQKTIKLAQKLISILIKDVQ
ncbi:MAG: arginase family protein [Candidatus Levybacteria bacterium]|nr:arginase family protein [Candidatus Levybacteria bacterium]